jgi:hypothetical protein
MPSTDAGDPSRPVCLFCNGTIGIDDEACGLNLTAAWTDSVATYWCHGGCLQSAVHPEIPLYILSLHRDEAVYGTAAIEEQPES